MAILHFIFCDNAEYNRLIKILLLGILESNVTYGVNANTCYAISLDINNRYRLASQELTNLKIKGCLLEIDRWEAKKQLITDYLAETLNLLNFICQNNHKVIGWE